MKQEECSCQSMHIRVRICVDGCVNRHGIIKELVCMGMYPGCGMYGMAIVCYLLDDELFWFET